MLVASLVMLSAEACRHLLLACLVLSAVLPTIHTENVTACLCYARTCTSITSTQAQCTKMHVSALHKHAQASQAHREHHSMSLLYAHMHEHHKRRHHSMSLFCTSITRENICMSLLCTHMHEHHKRRHHSMSLFCTSITRENICMSLLCSALHAHARASQAQCTKTRMFAQ
jgi:hypothetical protein